MSRSSPSRLGDLIAFLLVLPLLATPGNADDIPPSPAPPAASSPKKVDAEHPAPEPRTSTAETTSPPEETASAESIQKARERERNKQIALAMFLLVGVALASMVGFAVLWGIRTRRIVRQPLPPAPRGDELWFLKKPLTPPTTPGTQSTEGDPPSAAPGGPQAPPTPPAQPPAGEAS